MFRFLKLGYFIRPTTTTLLLLPEAVKTHPFALELMRALEQKNVAFEVADPANIKPGKALKYASLMLAGGLAVQHYLNPASKKDFIQKQTKSLVQLFYRNARPIAAPCMALPIVVEALRGSVKPDQYYQYQVAEQDMVIWEQPKLMSSNRPIMGKDEARKAAELQAFVAHFIKHFNLDTKSL